MKQADRQVGAATTETKREEVVARECADTLLQPSDVLAPRPLRILRMQPQHRRQQLPQPFEIGLAQHRSG